METVKIDFPDRDLFILKDGDWRGYRSHACEKEPETVAWIRSFPEHSAMWDVGASVGPYSLIAAALGHTVKAFEPFAPSYSHLVRNLWLNKMAKVVPIPVALGRFTGWDQLRGESMEAGTASRGVGDYAHLVSMMTADDADKDFATPQHVKIDVDGVELAVIEGGRNLWKQVDSIMVESKPPVIDDIAVILGGAGLQLTQSWRRLGETKEHNYLFKRAQ